MRVLVAGVLALFLLGTTCSWAQESPDVRLVVDVSGSMKQNDPNRLSGSALELLVSLLPSGVTGGLWTFGSEVTNPLPSSTVDQAWRERALALKPALVDYQQFTDIERAVREAARASSGAGERHLILLTDGVVDIPAARDDKRRQDTASRKRLLDDVVPRLAEEGVVIHTVAFSPDVDQSLVRQMASTTGGLATVAETPEALLRAFLDVIDRIFPVDQVPLEEDTFAIYRQVDAFSALLFHGPDAPPLALIGPDGKRYTAEDHPEDIQWQAQGRFDVITIPDPETGEWQIEGRIGRDSRINVDSSLSLRVEELPTVLYMDFSTRLEAWVENQGSPLTADSEPDNLVLRAELENAQGQVEQSVRLERTNDHFAGSLPAPDFVGSGRLLLTAISGDFVRQRQQAVSVRAAVSARVDESANRVLLHAEHPRLRDDNTRIRARLQGQELPVDTVDHRDWRIELPELDPDITVPLELTATVTLEGETRVLELPTLHLNADAARGVGSVRLDREGLSGESLQPAASEEEPEASLADRVGDNLSRIANTVPRLVREHRDDPAGWMAIATGVILILIVLLWRRRAAYRRRRPREEPHV
ncbi:TIGR03503 family protein [Modicisalibacter ilicicola DSM 19980]|uniref:TIGR03503 family protein n=1 Tax=Modicisalibacter ilicicola DSM 19980 TaxID=1121942 RepID=A0A1M4YKG4_9GAMM|nr:vWA domain-containing protein [Halomonas ilicicola]SHF05992.1 TIGR03503 family protein [Halomonas ilicicola DSM 19980]